ncbi:MAG: class F sortase, partial [Acidimicrobiia bacterium]
LALAALGLVLGAIALLGYLSAPRDAGDVERVEATLIATATTSTLDEGDREPAPEPEARPMWAANESPLLSEVATSTAPVPLRLSIPALGIDAPVGAYGVDDNGQMDVPDNVTEAGWYKFGPAPGEPGSAVIAAHVDLAGPGRGLFYDLDELEPGDTVTVSYSDGSISDFDVFARSIYLKTELPLETIFSRTGSPVLTLITCGGGFSRSANRYDSNVVVYAVPAGTANPTVPAS